MARWSVFLRKRKQMPRDYLITGIPRSGTSLLSRLLDDQADSVVVNEPIEAQVGVHAKCYRDFVVSFHGHLRQRILEGNPIRNKLSDGAVSVDTAVSNERVLYTPSISTSDFLLGTKDTLAYLSRLDVFRAGQAMKIVVCIRDPRNAIASWKRTFKHLADADVAILAAQGILEARPRESGARISDVARIGDAQRRRALFWTYLAGIIADNRDWICLVRYEDLISDTEAVLARVLAALDERRTNDVPMLRIHLRPDRTPTVFGTEEATVISHACRANAALFGYSL